MEEVVMTKNSKKYGFEKGAKFNVLRNVSGECVVMSPSGRNTVSYTHLTLPTKA